MAKDEFSYANINNDLFKLLKSVAHDAVGIVNTRLFCDVNVCFADSDPAVVRKAKRKFRKLWRNAARRKGSDLNIAQKSRLGLGSPIPTRSQKHARRVAINEMINNRVKKNYVLITK